MCRFKRTFDLFDKCRNNNCSENIEPKFKENIIIRTNSNLVIVNIYRVTLLHENENDSALCDLMSLISDFLNLFSLMILTLMTLIGKGVVLLVTVTGDFVNVLRGN